jgi:hypothetical protein
MPQGAAGVMRACAFAALAVAATAGVASARQWSNWKDGCPPYLDPVLEDLGFVPDADSALAPSRFVTSYRATGLRKADERELSTVQAVGISGHLVHRRGPMASVTLGGAHREGEAGITVGNLAAFAGYRHVRPALGEAARLALATRVGEGGAPSGDGDGEERERTRITARSPFEVQAFAYDRPRVLTLEARAELIGCHAPFAQLRLDAVQWRAGDGASRSDKQPAYAFPMRLTLGGYPRAWMAIAVQLGIEWRTREELLEIRRITRVRVLAELRLGPVRAVPHVALLSGTERSAGFEVGLLVAVEHHPARSAP